jgi:hypothetical protein
MAGVNVIYETAKFTWSVTGSTVQPTEWHLKWGTASGNYPNTKIYPVATLTDLLHNVVPGPGQYYAQLVAANSVGEGVKSNELPFVAGSGLPDGLLTFSVG